jgi:hypothetical protein
LGLAQVHPPSRLSFRWSGDRTPIWDADKAPCVPLHEVADCRGLQLGDDPAATMLRRGRVALSSGLQYGDAGAGHVRLNFGTSAELVVEIVHRMAAAA